MPINQSHIALYCRVLAMGATRLARVISASLLLSLRWRVSGDGWNAVASSRSRQEFGTGRQVGPGCPHVLRGAELHSLSQFWTAAGRQAREVSSDLEAVVQSVSREHCISSAGQLHSLLESTLLSCSTDSHPSSRKMGPFKATSADPRVIKKGQFASYLKVHPTARL
jgi:hypothetical protein